LSANGLSLTSFRRWLDKCRHHPQLLDGAHRFLPCCTQRLTGRSPCRPNRVGVLPGALVHWCASVELHEERGHAIQVHRHAALRRASIGHALEGTVHAAAYPARGSGRWLGDVSATSLAVRVGMSGEDGHGVLGAAGRVLRQVPGELADAAAQEPILRVCLGLLDVEAR
jgi:hypothetical protein